jgi:hypothetical protein
MSLCVFAHGVRRAGVTPLAEARADRAGFGVRVSGRIVRCPPRVCVCVVPPFGEIVSGYA